MPVIEGASVTKETKAELSIMILFGYIKNQSIRLYIR